MAEINQSTGKRSRIKMDMTPMVDLAFLLLTFFMLTTTLNKNYVMELLVPEIDKTAHPPVINNRRVVTLVLGAHDKIYWFKETEISVEKTDYSKDGIRKVLLDLNASIKDMVVFIKPSNESTYNNLVDILDEMNISGIKRYYLVDATSSDLALVKTRLTK